MFAGWNTIKGSGKNTFQNQTPRGDVSMWIRVALDYNAVHCGKSPEYTYVDGENIKEFYFDDKTAKLLEEDGFLSEMWSKLDALFDWGDCDYFYPEKCIKFRAWLEQRLKYPANNTLKKVYDTMLNMTNLAIEYNTGISFDF